MCCQECCPILASQLQLARAASVFCIIFDTIYASTYFLTFIAYIIDHHSKSECWETYGYGGHPR